jgi:aryl sulfotransferase
MTQAGTTGALIGWLVSYPKSGNTWMRMMLRSLRQGGGPVDINESGDAHILNRAEFEEHFGVESSDLTQAEIDAVRPELHSAIARASTETLILRKVHDRCWRTAAGKPVFPPEVSRGAVYIVRDPRDVAVSYAYHCHVDFEESVRRMGDSAESMARSVRRATIQLSQPLGSWSEHVTSWLDGDEIPVLLVRYEDMHADAAGELARVAKFLGLPEADDAEACAKAAAAARFSNLRGQEEKAGFREKPVNALRFFRQGRAGEGREVLPPHLLGKIEADHGAVMERLGYRPSKAGVS